MSRAGPGLESIVVVNALGIGPGSATRRRERAMSDSSVDVLLGHSNFVAYDPKQLQKMRPYAPLATLYAASPLRERGYSVALFDAMLADGEDEFVEALDQHRPRCGRALRRQLQLPEQDVPEPDARGRLPHERAGARRGRHRDRRRPGRDRSSRAVLPARRAVRARSARPITRWSSCSTRLSEREPRTLDRASRALRSPIRTRPAACVRTRRARARAPPDRLPVPGLGPGRRRALPRGLDAGATATSA